jgi:hypothetical protein
MKNVNLILVFLIVLTTIFFMWTLTSNAQPAAGANPVITAPLQVDLTNLFTSLTGLAAGVLFFTSIIKKYLNTTGTSTIIVSLIVSFFLGGFGWLLSLGIFAAVAWYYIIIYGVVVTALANGLSTWGFISDLLTLLKLKIPPVTSTAPPASQIKN